MNNFSTSIVVAKNNVTSELSQTIEIETEYNLLKSLLENHMNAFECQLQHCVRNYTEQITSLELDNLKLNNTNKELKSKYDEGQLEMANHRKVSIVSNFSRQILERDKQITALNKRIEHYINLDNTSASNQSSRREVNSDEKKVEESSEEASADEENVEEESEGEGGGGGNINESAEDSDDEVEFELKIINNKQYFISNEQPEGVYECTSDEDIGEYLGHLHNKSIIWSND